MQTILLHSRVHGTKECLVDDEDFQWLTENYRINVSKVQKRFYATAREIGVQYAPNKGLHRIIFRRHFPLADDQQIDHEDRNPLNNQKDNLRIATATQNLANKAKGGKMAGSIYKGVAPQDCGHGWRAQIRKDGTRHRLGIFDSERDAAIAYDIAAKHLYREFGVLNVPDATNEEVERILSRMKSPKRKRRHSSSSFFGVSYHKKTQGWFYTILPNRQSKRIYCYHFSSDMDAAIARDNRIDELGLVAVQKSLVDDPLARLAVS